MKTKRLYILRHGNAEPYCYEQDAQRALTKQGIEEVRSTAKQFSVLGEKLDAVFVSPYLRAQQTANEFLRVSGSQATPETLDSITPSGKELDVALWLHDLPYESILLVTHQPFAFELVEMLADAPLPYNFQMTTATMASLEGELFATACCQFRWAISPNY
ncbi:Phosphohistidine phosphatase SixA [Marinomonas gallaica]|uniref:Phosphohistidine phosphatase SixA n=1 Tax=Marinomonas gallaica TaxID=1806667 RepID=A0A1C3JUY9_9GAMM|nr:phosphohistidine phosphatase SixA [Marinomonas gallaica]SBT18899.1 Phosphohistidine phosphatase SixA [Marinomonas gallaica]SBT21854.1 Phosphohistidine phosphatase SixA [Marinomonas gallaica]